MGMLDRCSMESGGVMTVKSAYRMMVEHRTIVIVDESTDIGPTGRWREVTDHSMRT